MRQFAWHHALILLVAVVVLFTNLGGPRLWDRDEPRNAGCAWEMQQRGDWVVPVFNARLRDAKPVLLYWLIMSSYALFGVNEFAARFPSALLGLGTVLATYHIGRRLFRPQAALWGAIALSTTLMFDVAARAATPDSVLIFFSTMALLVYVLGTFRHAEEASSENLPVRLKSAGRYFPTSWPVIVAMYAMMGCGVLAKGPVGLVLPTAVIGMFLLIVRLPQRGTAADVPTSAWNNSLTARAWRALVVAMRPFWPPHFVRTCWAMRPITAIAVVLAIAAPWYWWVGVRTDGQFLLGFFVKEHLGRATTAMESHDGGLLFYPIAILVGFFPWSVFAAPVLIGLVQRLRRRDAWHTGYLLMACWTGVYVTLFTIVRTKLPSYITPCYPALALMTGGFIYHWSRNTSLAAPLWPRMSMLSLALVGGTMLVAIPFAAGRWLPGDEWLATIGLIPLLGSVGCLVLMERGRRRGAAVAFTVTAGLLVVSLIGVAAQRIDRHQQSHVLLEAIDRHSSSPRVGSFGCLESSWVYYLQRPIEELDLKHAGKVAVTRETQHRAVHNWEPPPRIDVSTFFASEGDVFLITTRDRLPAVRDELPSDVRVIADAPYFLKGHTLVVLGRVGDATKTAAKPRHMTGRR